MFASGRIGVASVAVFGLSQAACASCAGLSPGAISAKFSAAAAVCDPVAAPVVIAAPAMLPERRPAVSIPYAAPRRARFRGAVRADGGDVIVRVSHRYGIDPLLLTAIVRRESGFAPGAVSNKGALGLMQVMPGTARTLGLSDPSRMLSDPELSLSTGATYLKQLQGRFGNDVPAVLAAYNAGPGAVQRYGRAVPYRETRDYVSTIMTRYRNARLGQRR